MNIYIAGPMTGLPDLNYPAFHQAAKQLTAQGHTPINPANTTLPNNSTWLQYMQDCIPKLIHADAIALLPGWQNSTGATIEANLAQSLGIPTHPLTTYLHP